MIKKILNNILKIPRGIEGFIVGSYNELKLTEYLSRKKTLSYTLLVLGFLVLGTLFILGVDTVLLKVRDLLFSI
ncbi:MAG: preprotein translocase subunit SecE [Candidatus Dojkabacteria bacterium]